jgi:hypothetical protein
MASAAAGASRRARPPAHLLTARLLWLPVVAVLLQDAVGLAQVTGASMEVSVCVCAVLGRGMEGARVDEEAKRGLRGALEKVCCRRSEAARGAATVPLARQHHEGRAAE